MRPTQDEQALFEAVETDNIEEVRRLVDDGVDVNAIDTTKYKGYHTPLIRAACAGSLESIKLLISQGANVGDGDEWGCNALMHAAARRHTDVAQLLAELIINIKIGETRND